MSQLDERLRQLQLEFPHLSITETPGGLEVVIPSRRPVFQAIHIYLLWEETSPRPASARIAYAVKDDLPGSQLIERETVTFTDDPSAELRSLIVRQIQDSQTRTGFQKLKDALAARW